MMRIEVDGQAADAQRLSSVAFAPYGHFTAMQVRGQRVRGLELHLQRMAAAHREMFDATFDREQVVALIRHALGETEDASVRVVVQWPEGEAAASVSVVVRPPTEMPGLAWRLRSVPYQRSVAHIKHVGDFGQSYYGRLARRDGFDEALLTGPDGVIAEGSMTNIGFFAGTDVVWPAAPVLAGITMQLLQAGLATNQRQRVVRLADLGDLDGIFVCNSWGVAAVSQVDDRPITVDSAGMARLQHILDATAWDPIEVHGEGRDTNAARS
jgi:branched-subunit amino acid aminotransferase/4-amino-4-deoxychorismate lyase